MMFHCNPVFDLLTAGYRAWPVVAVGSGITVVLITIFGILHRITALPRTVWLAPATAVVLTVVMFLSTWIDYRAAVAARTSGNCEIVEGRIENFVPEPLSGHAKESFTVAGKQIHYGTAILTPGFHLSRARGGPFGPGVHVRLWLHGDDILYAEVCEE